MNRRGSKSSRIKKIAIRVVVFSAIVAITVFLFFKFSPWPSALLIRHAFEKDAKHTNERLEKHVPNGVSEVLDVQYNLQDADAKLDIYYPTSVDTILPLVVWVHGGGWVSGDKRQMSNYLKIVSSKGYVVASIDYSIAPGKHYPTPVKQVMKALEFIQEHAENYHIDASEIFLAGDSAGSHIVAQVANVISEPSYAELVWVTPSIERSKIKGLILYCGVYMAEGIDLEGEIGEFQNTVLWAYSGNKNYMDDAYFQTASVLNFVGNNFPPSFISAGNADPFLDHSQKLARKLDSLKVQVDTLFFPKDLTPKLPHEYQFNLDVEEGNIALDRSLIFLKMNRK